MSKRAERKAARIVSMRLSEKRCRDGTLVEEAREDRPVHCRLSALQSLGSLLRLGGRFLILLRMRTVILNG